MVAVHLVTDNLATHQHPRVKAWLVRHPRFRFTTLQTNRFNQVERWIALIGARSGEVRSATSVRGLIHKIDSLVTYYNASSGPSATADSILRKLLRLTEVINGYHTSS